MESGKQVGISREQVLVSLIPFGAVLPAGLLEFDNCEIAMRLEAKARMSARGPDGGKLFRSHGGEDEFSLGHETDDSAASSLAAGVVRRPFTSGTEVDDGRDSARC